MKINIEGSAREVLDLMNAERINTLAYHQSVTATNALMTLCQRLVDATTAVRQEKPLDEIEYEVWKLLVDARNIKDLVANIRIILEGKDGEDNE